MGTATINNCYAYGTHSGIEAKAGSKTYVNGGTYEGYGHGGFYFINGSGEAYVQNATIREAAMPNGYIDSGAECNGAGFYIGSEDNITVYMDNCKIYGSRQPIALRGSDGEQNNTLYISNSTINKGTTSGIRIDNDTHKLYIGQGCNFTADDVTVTPSAVISTNDVYTRP